MESAACPCLQFAIGHGVYKCFTRSDIFFYCKIKFLLYYYNKEMFLLFIFFFYITLTDNTTLLSSNYIIIIIVNKFIL